ncbi:MAG TPA: SDR family oxidoreductase [bacterium]|nr:SDR family oxidoreductase [bacterium]
MPGAALVTGGGKRIGRTLCLRLADAGYDIAVHYGRSEEEAAEVCERVRKRGRRCEIFQADLSDRNETGALLSRVKAGMPGLRVLVNSASIFEKSDFLETEDDLLDRHWEINIRAPFMLTRDFARLFGQGCVVNILDTKINRILIRYFAYSLTKKALADFTRMAAKELAPSIRVNGVALGLILPSASMSKEEFENLGRRIPLQRTGDPDLIADAVIFLVAHPFITGEILNVDGGEHLM